MLVMSKSPKSEDRHVNPREVFHLTAELQDALEEYLAATRPSPKKSEVMRTALEEFLVTRGFWPPKDGKKAK